MPYRDIGGLPSPRFSAALAVGAMAAALALPALGQADNTNSLTAADWVPDPAQYTPYSGPYSAYYGQYYSSRQAYMEEAGRRWDAEAEIHRSYRSPYAPSTPYVPYASERDARRYDAQDRRGAYIGGVGIGQDTNPNDYEVGIYNPKQ